MEVMGGKKGKRVKHAHQACRLAKRVSIKMISAVAKRDNPAYYDDCVAMGKKKKVEEVPEVAVPVEED